MRKHINLFLSPFNDVVIDRCLILSFMICVTIAAMSAKSLDVTPAPIPIAFRIIHYLLEVDSTACYGQNTKQNRKMKHEIIDDTIILRTSSAS
jgi:hypothetical protein